MFMEKPSCIKKLKQISETLLSQTPIDECINDIQSVLNMKTTNDNEKLFKIKEICVRYGKRITKQLE